MTPVTSSPVLIFGCRRSGTTLLRSLLDNHPNLLVHPKEPQFIVNLVSLYGNLNRNKEKIIGRLLDHPYLPEDLNKEQLKRALLDSSVQTWSDFFQTYLKIWTGDLDDKQQIVLKDPAFTFNMDILQNIFPDARYIHIVRQPYGNVSSQRARWQDASVWECATWWRDAVRIGHTMAMEEPELCLEVDYQSLVLEPEPVLNKICNFLRVPYTNDMLDFQLDTVSFSPDGPPKPTQFTALDPKRLKLWQNYLSSLDIKIIEHCCKHEMQWWQYEMVTPDVNNQELQWRILKESTQYNILKYGRKLKHLGRIAKNRIAS